MEPTNHHATAEAAASVPVVHAFVDDQWLAQQLRIAVRLLRIGCRVSMTQTQIARRVHRSRQFVNEQIGLMRDHGLIVNQGRGWYELDAALCWRGDLDLRNAYAPQQIVRDGLIITEGDKVIKRTGDMEDEEAPADADHSPPGFREEEGGRDGLCAEDL